MIFAVNTITGLLKLYYLIRESFDFQKFAIVGDRYLYRGVPKGLSLLNTKCVNTNGKISNIRGLVCLGSERPRLKANKVLVSCSDRLTQHSFKANPSLSPIQRTTEMATVFMIR